MLNVLRRIVQEVNAAPDLEAALQLMVKQVREACNAQAATIYLVDDLKSEYVLIATVGLNPKASGKVRFSMDKGLVGLVGQREEPINIDDMTQHLNFLVDKKVGEEKLFGFLGVPYHSPASIIRYFNDSTRGEKTF